MDRVLFHEQWGCDKGSYADNYYIKGNLVFFLSHSLIELRYELRKAHQGSNVLEVHPKVLGSVKIEVPYVLGIEWKPNHISKSEVEELLTEKVLGVLVACVDGA